MIPEMQRPHCESGEDDRVHDRALRAAQAHKGQAGQAQMTAPSTPTIVRNPELAAVLAELQRVCGSLIRIEELLNKPMQPITNERDARLWWSWQR